jgi:hypothetical protein
VRSPQLRVFPYVSSVEGRTMNLYPIMPACCCERTPPVNGDPPADASVLKPVLIHYFRMGLGADRLVSMSRPAGQPPAYRLREETRR